MAEEKRVYESYECRKCKYTHKEFLYTRTLGGKRNRVCNICRGRNACQICDKPFNNPSNMRIHVRAVHEQIREFHCEYDGCNYRASHSANLRVHVESVHINTMHINCDNCDFVCSSTLSLIQHKKAHCSKRRKGSAGEVRIMEVLESMGIEYKHDRSYEVRSDRKLLRWDFIIKHGDRRLMIEFDGRQHFKPVYRGSGDRHSALERFNRQKYLDNIKDEYSVQSGNPLLRIPYNRYDAIENMITLFIVENYPPWSPP